MVDYATTMLKLCYNYATTMHLRREGIMLGPKQYQAHLVAQRAVAV
jgi:hypothetical protein